VLGVWELLGLGAGLPCAVLCRPSLCCLVPSCRGVSAVRLSRGQEQLLLLQCPQSRRRRPSVACAVSVLDLLPFGVKTLGVGIHSLPALRLP
jgi:hypothetical protein